MHKFGFRELRFVVVCDGGLGNRLNTLYSGLILCDFKDIEPIIYWPVNEYCGLSIKEVIDNFNLPQYTTLNTISQNKNTVNLSHDVRKFNVKHFINLNCVSSLNGISLLEEMDYLYSSPLIPLFVRKSELVEIRDKYPLTERYSERLDLNKRAVGLHLRGTDYGFPEMYFSFFLLVVKFSPFVKYRVFTDDEKVSELFEALDNVTISDQKNLPHKKEPTKEWRHDFGNTFTYNIVRGENGVKDAISEMHDLSRTFKLFTSRSTFLFHAYLIDNKSIGFHLCFYYNAMISFLRLVRSKRLR